MKTRQWVACLGLAFTLTSGLGAFAEVKPPAVATNPNIVDRREPFMANQAYPDIPIEPLAMYFGFDPWTLFAPRQVLTRSPLRPEPTPLHVHVHSTVPAKKRKRFEEAAKRINDAKIEATADRVLHFQWFRRKPPGTFRGWNGLVHDVSATDGNLLITVRVFARLDFASAFDYVEEVYSVTDDGIRLVGMTGPPPTWNPTTFH